MSDADADDAEIDARCGARTADDDDAVERGAGNGAGDVDSEDAAEGAAEAGIESVGDNDAAAVTSRLTKGSQHTKLYFDMKLCQCLSYGEFPLSSVLKSPPIIKS